VRRFTRPAASFAILRRSLLIIGIGASPRQGRLRRRRKQIELTNIAVLWLQCPLPAHGHDRQFPPTRAGMVSIAPHLIRGFPACHTLSIERPAIVTSRAEIFQGF